MIDKSVIYAITGATGNIGSRIARDLLSRGKRVRVIGRSPERLRPLADKGAEPIVASLEDAVATAKAFEGAHAVFTMIPPHVTAPDVREYQKKISESFVKALKLSATHYVVNLSSVGAHLTEGTGPILGLHDHEKRLNKIEGLNVVHLRPAYFMENLFANIDTIRNMGVVSSALKGNLPIAMIATKDIAAYAAEQLANLNFSGITARELLGSRDLTMAEITKVFAKAINRKDISYLQFPYAEAEKAMVHMGLSANFAQNIIVLNKGLNEGLVRPTESRSAQNTTPTTIEDFAQGFAEIYNSVAKVEVPS